MRWKSARGRSTIEPREAVATKARPNIEAEPKEISAILDARHQDRPQAARDLLPLVYDELRRLAASRIARECAGQTLQATSLVHEAYLRLMTGGVERSWNDRSHFFAAAADAMRLILIDRARNRKRLKRGGGWNREEFELNQVLDDAIDDDDLVDLDEALTLLAGDHPRAAELVKLRLFAGLTLADAAGVMGLPRRSADRLWAFARAWLFRAFNSPDADPK